MTSDYTRNEVDVLIDLIRDDNARKVLTVGQVTFGSPNVFTPVEGVDRDTSIIATSIPGRGYEGSQVFYYNRVALSDFVPADEPEVLYFNESDAIKLSDLLPELNERLSFNLGVDKIVDQTLPDLEDSSYKEVVLMLKPNSLVYTGQLTLRIVSPDTDLKDAIPDPTMDGLTYAPPAAA